VEELRSEFMFPLQISKPSYCRKRASQTNAWVQCEALQYLVSSESLTTHRSLLKDSTYKKRGAVTPNKVSYLLIKDRNSALYTSLNTSL
jgi:hypothetical protein